MSAALAQAQEVAEEASIVLLRNAMLCKDFVICCEKCSEGRVWRLLRVGYDLKEDVDVCARQLVSLITPIEKTETRNKLTSVTQRRQLLNPRRVWHSARVKIRLLTRFVSVVYTVAVLMADTAFARSYFLWIRVDKSCNAGIRYHVFVVSKKEWSRIRAQLLLLLSQESAHIQRDWSAQHRAAFTCRSALGCFRSPPLHLRINDIANCNSLYQRLRLLFYNQFLTTQSCRHHEQSRLRSSSLPPQNALLRYVALRLDSTVRY